ncbi:Ig-like domain-containing protein [Fibrivirga algicola]|uniref:T9SS type A sorting domain-containing protein n=1 Tax=Fibrivirga algicola TaxID=2950420 RepID=A0ABX0QAX5_9BACT|nr:T9SS type A sorting domain-containing protein [Fibrivirga algicola]NID08982.1 T9SS type A sorting domain-containing protein [Fibrivirga algicola]
MTRLLPLYLLMTVCVYISAGRSLYAQRYWNFSVEIAIEKQTADYYQELLLKDIKTIASEQISTVNANFNTRQFPSSPSFNGLFNFYIDTIYIFDGSAQREISKPHNRRDYKLIVNGFSAESSGGGWYGSYKTIYHNWKWDYFGGPFGGYATDGLTHEFGHARGAIDIYALKVDADKNPVNHTAFQPIQSIMDYPYGNIRWDEHTVNIINSTGSAPILNESYITTAFPANLIIKSTDSQGIPIENTAIDLYPVNWFSYSVSPTPSYKAGTTNKGLFRFPVNPFQPGIIDYPWHIKYSNFLVKATYKNDTLFQWMPLYDVQNTFFTQGLAATYSLTFSFPVKVVPIKITSTNSSTLCVGDSIRVFFSATDLFNEDNRFTLQLTDSDETVEKTIAIGSSPQNTNLAGYIPATIPGGKGYKLRIVSSSPYSESNFFPLYIKPRPAVPLIAAPTITACQSSLANPLVASGQHIRWYTSPVGGSGIDTLRPSTNLVATTSYYVSQQIDGCEGPRGEVSVIVKSKPAPPIIADKTICQQFCRTTSSCDYLLSGSAIQGASLNWYAENGNPYEQLPGRFGTNYIILFVNEVGWRIGNNTLAASQTLDGCESDRTPFILTLNKNQEFGPGNGDGNSFAVCQNSGTYTADNFAGPAPIGFQNYYYDPKTGLGSITAPVISTSSAAIYSFQTAYLSDKGCLSPKRTNGTLYAVVKPQPNKPTLPQATIVYCQGQATTMLTATADANASLIWYGTDSTGGTGSASAPRPVTTQAGTFRYYVAQLVAGCEGPRAAALVLVKPLPATPGVTQINLCQFTNASPLTALGSGLTWYGPDGGLLGNTGPTPATDKGDTLAYQVSQTVDGCTSLTATLVVTVLTTPPPGLPIPRLTLCQGSNAALLEATGTNLKWTDSAGVPFTTAPRPSTAELTTNPAGDAYYVSQTGANGCESPRSSVHVFVVGPPTLMLAGDTTVNLGIETSLSLKFTSVGPYQYKILGEASQPLSGSAVKDTSIMVLPTRTTTYRVIEVSNRCGVGLPVRTATVVVLVPTIQTQPLDSTTVCAGSTLAVGFSTTGQFNPGSTFQLQLAHNESDTSNIKYINLATSQVADGQLSGTIPATATAGTYLVRVVATNPKIPIFGTASSSLVTIHQLPEATLATSSTSIYEGDVLKLSVTLTGTGPWTFVYRDSSKTENRTREVLTNANLHVIDLKPLTTSTFQLISLKNECGASLFLPAAVVVTVNPLLAAEPVVSLVKVFPVPVTSIVTVQLDPSLMRQGRSATLKLINTRGTTTLKQETRQLSTQLNLDEQPAGSYVLQVRVGERLISKHILKY